MILGSKIKEISIKHLIVVSFVILLTGQSKISYSQVDNEFWFVVPELSHRGNTGGTPGTLRIATLELPATVTISMPANPYHPVLNPTGFQDIVVNIAANSTAAVDLSFLIDIATNPLNNRLENKPLTPSGINNFGLHITATNMITVYWEVNYDYGSDLWTLKGSNGLGTLFYTPFQTVYNNRNLTPRTYSAIDIVATTDNTQVTITLPPGKAASYGSLLSGIAAGGTYSLILNAGQTFSVFPFNYSIFATDRLAGTRIVSTEPIAVTVKDDAIASGSQGQDVIGDQLVPVNVVGSEYIVPEINNPNHVYVLATENNTNIYVYDAQGLPIGPTPYTTLNQGQQALVIVPGGSKYAHITSNDPAKTFYTFQMGIENQSRGGALIPAIGCTGNTQLAFTRARSDNKFYFFIIVKKGSEDKFVLDGIPQTDTDIIKPGSFTEILGSGGYMAWFSGSINSNILSVGQHLVENTGDIFHLGILNGFPGASQGRLYYGYYSDFGGLNIGANVAGTNSSVVRACFGDPVQLYAYGGTNYLWTPDEYLDDATSNLPTASNLPPGPHNYTVEVSGACNTGTIDLQVLVSTPVVAFFQTNVASGCSPLEIQFDDQSSGGFSWQYEIDDTLIRYDLDPVTPYPPPPNYPLPFSITHIYRNVTNLPIVDTVTLLVKNESGCADIFTKTITVFPEIYSDFTTTGITRGCDPLTVQFQNNSSGNTDTWYWDFGDGGSSIDENPQHTFRNQFGPDSLVFDTRLIAISPYYCTDTSTQTVTVMPYIEANFVFDTVFACTPHDIVITDQSFGADSYFWDFGDGTTSTSPGPQILKTYINNSPAPVTYTIKLRVENDEGCFDELQRQVTVYPEISASFIASTNEGCSPFEVQFLNNSTGAATYYWDFGDGGTSTDFQPVHLYDRNMMDHDTTYTVTLITTSANFCRDTATIDILVHPYIKAAFAINDIIGCHPFIITIDNQSIGAEQYFWDFGDGSPVSTTTQATFDHMYLNTGNSTIVYPLQLVVMNAEGCTDTLIRNITVHPEITVNFTASAFEGCHPLTVSFADLSVNAIDYYWDFGDGASSVEPSPVHTFTNFGISDTSYLVSLTVSTADGECIKSIQWPIIVHGQVIADFTAPSVIGCNPFEAVFENVSVGGSNYYWDFGDGSDTITTDLNPVVHTFINNDFLNTTQYEVILTAENDAGCSSESRKTISVYPAIQTNFVASQTIGCHPLTVDFTNLTNGGQSYIWDFGDGATSSLSDPSHTFLNTGTIDSIYTVILTTLSPSNGCMDSFSIDITVNPYIQANFTIPDRLDCSPFDVLIYNSSVNGSTFRWDFGDGTDTITYNTDPIIHRYINTDYINQQDFVITLVAENSAGCSSTVQRSITVEPDIKAEFVASQIEGCHPLTVDFTNLSSGAAYYHWDFGNGTNSSLINPSQTFTNIGSADTTYHVWLYATASNNVCTDSFYIDIIVHPYIHADFTFEENIQCSPFTVQFNNASSGGSVFYWDFGDGSDTITTDLNPVSHVFNNLSFVNNSTFQVTMTAENIMGCSDQVTKSIEVYPDIEALFSVSIDEGCHPLQVDFTNLSNGGFTYLWDFGDGSSSTAFSPSHVFTNFTDSVITRQISLLAVSRYNCQSEINAEVTIHPKPKARFETDEVISCPPFDIQLSNSSVNADTYHWSFGDGTILDINQADTINHIYDNTTNNIATYTIKLNALSNFGCVDSIQQNINVYPRTIADFSSNNEGCTPLTTYFLNESILGETYLWDFGDGSSTSLQDPTHVYFNFSANDTSYYVTLTSMSKYGCIDTTSGTIYVYPQPEAEFTALPGYQVYPSSTVSFDNLTNPGTWSYQWDMDDGTTSILEDPPPHTYATWGEYNIKLNVGSDHCYDSVSHIIRILPGPPIASFDSVAAGCEPLTVQFRNTSLYGDSYLWEFDDGTTSTEFEPLHTFTEAGIYNVKLTVTGEGGRDYAYRQVEVYRKPFVNFTVSPQTVMLPDQEVQLYNLSEEGTTFLWDFGDGNTSTDLNPRYLYSAVGTYDISLDVWTDKGCTDRLVKSDAVVVLGKGLIIFPNAFEPDMSGPNGGYYNLNAPELNTVFHPHWEGVEEYNLKIFDRWGTLLYESYDVMRGWDGYYQGKLCQQGVYVWKSTGTFSNGQPFMLVGDVTLIRHRR